MNCSTQHRFFIINFFYQICGRGGAEETSTRKKPRRGASSKSEVGVRCILNFVYQHCAPIMEWRQFVQNFLQPPPPLPEKRGENCPPPPDVTFLQPYKVYPGSYNSTLVYANSLYICKSLDRKNSRFSLNPYYLVFLVRAIRDFAFA